MQLKSNLAAPVNRVYREVFQQLGKQITDVLWLQMENLKFAFLFSMFCGFVGNMGKVGQPLHICRHV